MLLHVDEPGDGAQQGGDGLGVGVVVLDRQRSPGPQEDGGRARRPRG